MPNQLTVSKIPFPPTFNSTVSKAVNLSGPGLPARPSNSPLANGGAFDFAGGAPGAGDFITGPDLAAILPDGPLKSILSATYVTIPAGVLPVEYPAGLTADEQFSAALLYFGTKINAISGATASTITPSTVAGVPRFTLTTTAPTGTLFIQTTAASAQ